jgi:hypothetical protein
MSPEDERRTTSGNIMYIFSRVMSDYRRGLGLLNTLTNYLDWNQLPADLLASFPYKLNTFRKRVKKAVTDK